MAVTQMNNMINPEVMGDMIEAKILAMAKITPYAKVDNTLAGVPGDTKTVPSWNYIGDAEDVEEGAEVGLTSMTASSTTFGVKKAMKAVGLTQEAVNSGLGNPIGQAETQLAKSIVGKVDNDVIDAAYTGKSMYAGSSLAVIGYDRVVEAVGTFSDEEETDKVMFIHPTQETTLRKDINFLSADKYQAGVAVRGAIGMIAGCQIKKSKKVMFVEAEKSASGTVTITADNIEAYKKKTLGGASLKIGDKVTDLAAANKYYCNPIIKLEPDSTETEYTEDELPAITIFLKKDTAVDTEWMPKKQQTDITACKYYGVALTNDAKVVLAKNK